MRARRLCLLSFIMILVCISFQVRFAELYNGHLFDLLDEHRELFLKEDSSGLMHIRGQVTSTCVRAFSIYVRVCVLIMILCLHFTRNSSLLSLCTVLPSACPCVQSAFFSLHALFHPLSSHLLSPPLYFFCYSFGFPCHGWQ